MLYNSDMIGTVIIQSGLYISANLPDFALARHMLVCCPQIETSKLICSLRCLKRFYEGLKGLKGEIN